MRATLTRAAFLKAAAVFALAAAPVATTTAVAQDYPSRNVTIVVPYPPGGSIDRLARQVADHLGRTLNQPFIVENRPGGNGIVAVEQVRRAAPDGHTLLIGGNSTHSIGPATDPEIKYDPIKDFVPVAYLGDSPIVITAGPSFKPSTVPEIAERAKAKARSVSYGAVGHSMFLTGRLFEKAVGAELRHVSYKGFGPAVLDIARGDVNLGVSTIPIVIGNIQSKMVRPIAVTSQNRVPILPDVPTVAETYPGFEALTWFAIFAPAGLPADVAGKLHAEISRFLDDAGAKEGWAKEGFTLVGKTQADFAAYLAADLAKWTAAAEASGLSRK